ncbi:MAG TPA: DUF2225 domain-containing protein [Spirochaetota bacterium]|nr:DUF2225 domain-containing protein [Spirochaetota bacterium]HPP05034.1 DUF2225 domain-containing protein [Spirochaetota bacterium]
MTILENGAFYMSEESKFRPKITFLSKEATTCPVCEEKFFNENLMIGGGRLIADEITDKLHRTYKPSAKFGKIYPLIYSVMVCPHCYYASLQTDFEKISDEGIEALKEKTLERIEFANKLCGEPIDYTKYKTLKSGAVSYVLAVQCYDYFNKKQLPVIKQAICSVRAAYLFEDLNKEYPNRYYDYLSEMFYKKALFFYEYATELNRIKEQIMETLKPLGPDIDKDYGYDGLMYMIAVLTYCYGDKSDPERRKKDLEKAKLYFGKLFGMGKSNVDKPKEILEKSRYFYEIITKELK